MKTSHHHIIGTDGQPFFWLADTAWNLWCRGTPDEWDTYLAARKRQGFTAIQFVAGWWRGCSQPIHGKTFDVVDGELIFDEKALRSLDLLMQKIRDAGLVASPVMLWTLMNYDPGQVLSEEQCIEVGRRLLERYDADNVVWLLGGDGNYTAPQVEARWKRIGRAVFADQPDAMATLHPCGVTWVGDAFAAEPWYRLATIQSGHGARENNLRFLVSGDYASAWTRLDMPFINLEPNYENARSYGDRKHLTAYHVRRASHWSLLVAPPAGVTFGINSIWIWASSPNETAERHENAWVGQPWHQELDTPGARSMTVLRAFFESLPWTRLKPAPQAEPPARERRRRELAGRRRDARGRLSGGVCAARRRHPAGCGRVGAGARGLCGRSDERRVDGSGQAGRRWRSDDLQASRRTGARRAAGADGEVTTKKREARVPAAELSKPASPGEAGDALTAAERTAGTALPVPHYNARRRRAIRPIPANPISPNEAGSGTTVSPVR
jgi:hypothetical protein